MKLELVADTTARTTVHVVWISKLSVLSFSVFFMENLEVLHSYFVHFKEKLIIKYFFLRGEKRRARGTRNQLSPQRNFLCKNVKSSNKERLSKKVNNQITAEMEEYTRNERCWRLKCVANFKFNTVEGGSYFPLIEESIELPVSLNGVELQTPVFIALVTRIDLKTKKKSVLSITEEQKINSLVTSFNRRKR